MANTNTICVSALMELMKACHAIGTPVAHTASTKDTFKAALYLTSATKNETTTVYDTTGEVTGTGYTAGGIAVTNATEPNYSGNVAFWTPSASFVYTTVTLSTAFNAVMIYNTTSPFKSISIHTFGDQTVTAGTFTLTMPVNDGSTGLIRFTRV